MKKPFYERQPLRFHCTGCGQCCTTGSNYYVFIAEKEVLQLQRHLGVSMAWFRRRYIKQLDDGGWVLASKDNDRCIFLQEDNRCGVYKARPVQCKTYPFWPEILERKSNWWAEAQRCEGVGRGKEVSLQFVKRKLDKQVLYDSKSPR